MGRDSRLYAVRNGGFVSTHAPAWGATQDEDADDGDGQFQPTRPHGARQPSLHKDERHTGFNPRARMGRDSLLVARRAGFVSFNPRARMGRDAGLP